MVLPHHIKPWTTGFVWIKVRVSHYQRFRITFMQFTKQPFQRTLLCFRSGVARSLAVSGKSSDIRHTDGMAVMVLAMRSNMRLRSSTLDGTVSRNHIVIPTTSPTERTVVAVNIRYSQCAARLIGRAMHNNQGNRSHTQIVLELRHGTASRPCDNQFNHSQHIQRHSLPVDLHVRRQQYEFHISRGIFGLVLQTFIRAFFRARSRVRVHISTT